MEPRTREMLRTAAQVAEARGDGDVAELLMRLADGLPLVFITGGVAVLPNGLPESIIRDYDNEEEDEEV